MKHLISFWGKLLLLLALLVAARFSAHSGTAKARQAGVGTHGHLLVNQRP